MLYLFRFNSLSSAAEQGQDRAPGPCLRSLGLGRGQSAGFRLPLPTSRLFFVSYIAAGSLSSRYLTHHPSNSALSLATSFRRLASRLSTLLGMRIQLPAALQTPLMNAVGRLEINFDPSVGVRRIKRHGWSWKRDAQYAFLGAVSRSALREGLDGGYAKIGVEERRRQARRRSWQRDSGGRRRAQIQSTLSRCWATVRACSLFVKVQRYSGRLSAPRCSLERYEAREKEEGAEVAGEATAPLWKAAELRCRWLAGVESTHGESRYQRPFRRTHPARLTRASHSPSRSTNLPLTLQLAVFSLAVMAHPLLFKIFLVSVYTLGLLIPFTGQFVLPATPIFSWLLLFYSAQFIPSTYRPHIWVSVLPTLESVLYGANISDILTRFTNPVLDIVAWLPYGVMHFAIPFFVAAFLFVFSPPGAVKFWAAAFGYVNIVGVMIQILFPCAPPCTSTFSFLHPLSLSSVPPSPSSTLCPFERAGAKATTPAPNFGGSFANLSSPQGTSSETDWYQPTTS